MYNFDEEPPEQIDQRVDDAKPRILEILNSVAVATDRELKVRLEREFFPWVVGRALGLLLLEDKVGKFGYPGRRPVRGYAVEGFYTVKGTDYSSVEETIKQKKTATDAITNILTGVSPAADHAEDLFAQAFRTLKFVIHGRNMSEFRGRKVIGVAGKEPRNIDFVIERDGVVYGVDVKNWIRYEWTTRGEVTAKVTVAVQLGVVPFIIARYVDQDLLYNEIYLKKGIAYRYGELLIPTVYDSVADSARRLLGYPILCVDALPDYKVGWIETLHLGHIKRLGD